MLSNRLAFVVGALAMLAAACAGPSGSGPQISQQIDSPTTQGEGPRFTTTTAAPSPVTAPYSSEAYVTTPFFDDFLGTSVDESKWEIATWNEHGGQTGRARATVSNGYLNLGLVNDPNQGVLSSALQTRSEFFQGRWETRLKASSCPGVLNSMFTIDWDNTAVSGSGSDGTKQEIDIELLSNSFTGSNGRVQFALHASGLTSRDTNPDIPLGFDPSAGFHTYGYDIKSDRIEWFVDGRTLWTYNYSGNPIAITHPYMFKLNFWTGGSWVGGPPPSGLQCNYQIDWVRFTPSST